MLRFGLAAVLTACALATTAAAQPAATQNVEVEPITCWWRPSATSIRMGEPFSLVLTCSILETEAARAVVDRTRLAPAALQLPPYEIIGGTQSEDVRSASRRFFQYVYNLRLIGEGFFGAAVPIPGVQLSYRIESRVSQDTAVEGREQTYTMPALSMHVASLVPGDATHIREAPAPTLAEIAGRESRGNLMRLVGISIMSLAALLFVVGLARAARQRRGAAAGPIVRFVSDAAVLAAVRRELQAVRHDAQGGWSADLAGRLLAALRVAGSYGLKRPVAQRPATSPRQQGEIAVGGRFVRSASVYVSGSATGQQLQTAASPSLKRLGDALAQVTAARYGRHGEIDDAAHREAVDAGLAAVKSLAAEHTWIAETVRALQRTTGGWRRRAWAS